MKTILLLLLTVLTFISAAVCPAQQTFVKSYGGTDLEQLMHPIIQAPDSGYCMGGITKSFGAGAEDVLLLKTDANGSVQWARTYGGPNVDFCHSLARTFDGGYIMSGWTSSFGNGYEAFLLKVSSNGSYQWMRTYGWSGSNEYAYSVVQSLDSGYAFLGLTSTGNDILFVKTDISGSVQWARTFGDPAVFDQGKLLIRTADSGYLLLARAASFGAGGRDFLLIKTDPSGAVQWSRTYGGRWDENIYDIIETSDGGYATCGRTLSFGTGGSEAMILKLSSDGSPQWARTYGDTAFDDFANSIVETPDGGYALSGHTKSYGAGLDECSLMKIDSAGNLQWARIFGGAQMDENLTIVQTPDGGYALNGFTASYGAGNRDGLLMKTAPNGGILGCPGNVTPIVGIPALITSSPSMQGTSVSPIVGTPTPTQSSPVLTTTDACPLSLSTPESPLTHGMELEVCPNPFSNTVYFQLPVSGLQLEVVDVKGKVVFEKTLDSKHETVSLNLPRGMYFYRVRDNGRFISSGKLLMQ